MPGDSVYSPCSCTLQCFCWEVLACMVTQMLTLAAYYMASCAIPVIHVWCFMCITCVLHIYWLHMCYTCILHTSIKYMCTCRLYIPVLHVRNMCITVLLHMYYNCMNYMSNIQRIPHMYYICITHVSTAYVAHLPVYYTHAHPRLTISIRVSDGWTNIVMSGLGLYTSQGYKLATLCLASLKLPSLFIAWLFRTIFIINHIIWKHRPF